MLAEPDVDRRPTLTASVPNLERLDSGNNAQSHRRQILSIPEHTLADRAAGVSFCG